MEKLLMKRISHELTSEHPIDLCRYQVLNCYNGRAGLINLVVSQRVPVTGGCRYNRWLPSAPAWPDLWPQGFPASDERRVDILECHQDVYILDKSITIAHKPNKEEKCLGLSAY